MRTELIKPVIEKVYHAASNFSQMKLTYDEVAALSGYLKMLDILLEDLEEKWDIERSLVQ